MLINNIDTLKKYIPTIVGDDFNRYSTYLESADEYLITELIGQNLFDTLTVEENIEGGIEGAAQDANLVRYCECVVAHKAYLDAIPFLDLVETETGFAVVSDTNNNVVPASTARVEKLIKGIETRLSDSIEKLLEYLEGNPDYYEQWKNVNAYAINHASYIFTLKEFRRYARYEGSRLEWIKDMPMVTQAIRMNIEPVISAELSAAIIQELQVADLSEANKVIIEDLRFALANFVTGNIIAANNFLFKVRKVIIDNVGSYPEFEASAIYTAYQSQTSSYSVDHSIGNFGAL